MKTIKIDGISFIRPTIIIKCYICGNNMIANAIKYEGEYMFICDECRKDLLI